MTDDVPANTVVESVAPRRKPPAAGMGRVKGVPNKVTKQLKDMKIGRAHV